MPPIGTMCPQARCTSARWPELARCFANALLLFLAAAGDEAASDDERPMRKRPASASGSRPRSAQAAMPPAPKALPTVVATGVGGRNVLRIRIPRAPLPPAVPAQPAVAGAEQRSGSALDFLAGVADTVATPLVARQEGAQQHPPPPPQQQQQQATTGTAAAAGNYAPALGAAAGKPAELHPAVVLMSKKLLRVRPHNFWCTLFVLVTVGGASTQPRLPPLARVAG